MSMRGISITTDSEVEIEKVDAIIKKHVENPGSFSHNIIGSYLRQVARMYGDEEANKLVRKHQLAKRFGIHEE